MGSEGRGRRVGGGQERRTPSEEQARYASAHIRPPRTTHTLSPPTTRTQPALYLLLAFLSPPNGLFFRELTARLVVTMDMTSLVVQRRLAK